MIRVPGSVIEAVEGLRSEGWKTNHLLNVSEFINVFFENAGVHVVGDFGDIIANYLAEDEENIVEYVSYVIS